MTDGLRLFVPTAESRSSWDRYHRFRRALDQERRPGDPVRPDHVIEFDLSREDPAEVREVYVLERGGSIVAGLKLSHSRPGSPGYPSGRHLLWVDAQVLPELRRQGIARSWLPRLASVMDGLGATTWGAYAELPAALAVLEAIGARRVFSGAENRLQLSAVDWELMEAWAGIDSGFRLELHEPRLPESLFETYCPAYTAMGRAVPTEEMDHGEWIITPERLRDQYARMDAEGSSHHVLVAFDGQDLVGVTECIQRPYEPSVLHQELTAVGAQAQGRGLGKQLKATLLLHLRELYPELTTVVTDNAGSNAPMLSINHRMGFRSHVAGHIYQMTRAELGRVL